MMTESLTTLLTKCQSSSPPYDSLIDSTLSSLSTSRFQFALELEQTLSRDNKNGRGRGEHGSDNSGSIGGNATGFDLNDQQRSCLILALHKIGKGFGEDVPTHFSSIGIDNNTDEDGDDDQENAFLGILKQYQEEQSLSQKNHNEEFNLIAKRLQESLPSSHSPAIRPAFFRPSPLMMYQHEQQLQSSATSTLQSQPLHFLHTSYPTLRYQWLPQERSKRNSSGSGSTNSSSSNNNKSSISIHNELAEKAFHSPLEIEEERILLTSLQQNSDNNAVEKNAKGGKKGNGNSNSDNPFLLLTPKNVPHLVEHNPTIAIEFLLKLHDLDKNSTSSFETSSSTVYEEAEYHSSLVNMDITLHAMEVVYKLATNHILHSEYLHVFVLGLFDRCKSTMHSSGMGMSGRGSSSASNLSGVHTNMPPTPALVPVADRKMIRLVSVFLQNLIENCIVEVEDFVELQAFCIENSRVREANTLFKLLKEKRMGDSAGGGKRNSGRSNTVEKKVPSKNQKSNSNSTSKRKK